MNNSKNGQSVHKFCTNCGAKIAVQDKFCTSCGFKFSSTKEEEKQIDYPSRVTGNSPKVGETIKTEGETGTPRKTYMILTVCVGVLLVLLIFLTNNGSSVGVENESYPRDNFENQEVSSSTIVNDTINQTEIDETKKFETVTFKNLGDRRWYLAIGIDIGKPDDSLGITPACQGWFVIEPHGELKYELKTNPKINLLGNKLFPPSVWVYTHTVDWYYEWYADEGDLNNYEFRVNHKRKNSFGWIDQNDPNNWRKVRFFNVPLDNNDTEFLIEY